MNQSGRMENARDALLHFRANSQHVRLADAALAEVEEWEAEIAEARGLRDAAYGQRDDALAALREYREQFNRWSEYEGPKKLAAAEAEADRLKAALTTLRQWDMLDACADGPWAKRLIDAALAPADRNTA